MKYAGLLALVFALCAPSYGQVSQLSVDIPFAFEFSGVRLDAGQYTFRFDGLLTRVRNVEQPKMGALFVASRRTPSMWEKSAYKVVFNKYGSRHFLAQVWTGPLYHQLMKSEQERELVTSRLLTLRTRVQTVVLAARPLR